MATNYQRGYWAERRIKELFETQGYSVVRAGASRGPYDLIAIPTESCGAETTIIIQVKSFHSKNFNVNCPSFLKTLKDFTDLSVHPLAATKRLVVVHTWNRKVSIYFYVPIEGTYRLARNDA